MGKSFSWLPRFFWFQDIFWSRIHMEHLRLHLVRNKWLLQNIWLEIGWYGLWILSWYELFQWSGMISILILEELNNFNFSHFLIFVALRLLFSFTSNMHEVMLYEAIMYNYHYSYLQRGYRRAQLIGLLRSLWNSFTKSTNHQFTFAQNSHLVGYCLIYVVFDKWLVRFYMYKDHRKRSGWLVWLHSWML